MNCNDLRGQLASRKIVCGGRIFGLVLGLLLWGGLWMAGASPLRAAETVFTLPPNFQMRTVVSGLNFPTDMVFLPSGDILVTEKGTGFGTAGVADVRLVRQGVLQAEPVMSLSVTVIGDSGLYTVVLDPNFAQNRYFYLWYSVGEQGKDWTGISVDRLSRFTYDPQLGKADLLSETVILDGIQWSQWHNGGGIAFDAEGNLFIATGDAAVSRLGQDVTSLNGKLLRIRPVEAGSYTVPADNPFVGDENVRPEIYALGFRNPFRMAHTTKESGEQSYYLVDVGAESWEEVNEVEAGANYGWAEREGPCPFQSVGSECPPTPPEYVDPIIVYPHPPGGGAGISALTFYTGSLWPELYRDKLFFADFNGHSLSMVDLNDPQTITLFGDEIGHLVDLEATEEGLYSLVIYDGEIRFIYYSEGGNQWPTAQLSASPTQGSAPLTVAFSAQGSHDPEGETLLYAWDFGDGSLPLVTAEQQITHTYMSDGDYQASLRALDPNDGKSEAQTVEIEVYSGAMPNILQEIVGDSARQRYRGGDTVRFRVARSGDKAGLDATTPYIWSIKQHHNQHVHFITAEFAGDEVVLEISDDSHAADVSLWYEVELTMLTDQGQRVRVTRTLSPDVVAMDIGSMPAGAEVTWNGVAQDSTQPIAAVMGQRFVLEAPLVLYHGKTKNRFVRWEISSDGGVSETITEPGFELLVTGEAKRFVAHYEFVSSSLVYYLPTMSYAPLD